MEQPSTLDQAAVVRRGLTAYQDAIVRISDIVRQGDGSGLAAPVQNICYHVHREVAQIFGVVQPDADPAAFIEERHS